ncbi:MAG TPA: restriction endonuclease [Thermoanaerobaculia bacterium]|nr:restriction endonuclease [Thermoanaerobaculia bacterium]
MQQVMEALIGVEVHHKRVYVGRVSGREIEVDISFETSIAGARLLCLVECKCYSKSVSVDEVEEFHSKLDDIGAHKGIMVTTVSFQDGAVKVAKGRGIALALLTRSHLPGELRYVALAAASPRLSIETNEGFWQGNLRGPLGKYGGGFRFESWPQFLSVLFLDEFEKERLEWVARWEKEHGPSQ